MQTSVLPRPAYHQSQKTTNNDVRGASVASAGDMEEVRQPAVAGVGAGPYRVLKATNCDAERIIDFLRRFFFKDEPLNIAVGLLDDPNSNCPELEQYCINSIPDGVSLMTVNAAGEIIGVCINGVDVRGYNPENDSKNSECFNPKFGKILNLLKTVGKQADVFGQFPDIDRMIEVRIISVDDAYRGQGIAKTLLERTKSMGKELGIPMMRVDCTSAFSAMAVARLGFQCVYTLQYAEYLDSKGEPVFIPPPPHSCVKTYVYPLN